jgi:hypothetical protein
MTNKQQESAAQQPDRRLSVPVTEPLASALARAAKADFGSVNSYVRRAIAAKLRADGFEVSEVR